MSDTYTTADLIQHMTKFYSDRHIVEDLGCVLDACRDDDERDQIKAYARLRKKAPGFKPGSFKANNHQAIAGPIVAPARTPGRPSGKKVECASCGVAFYSVRSSRRTCSAYCRKAVSRGPQMSQ